MRNFYCASNPHACIGSGAAGDEVLLVGLRLAPGAIGVPDPGGLGDRGITSPPREKRARVRERVPFGGLEAVPLAMLGGAFLAAGALLTLAAGRKAVR